MPFSNNKTSINYEQIQARTKRKWQTALRRYLLEDNPSVEYAPVFGLPAAGLRQWIELQFKEGMSWENFAQRWNISQRIPTALFDLTNPKDLSMCWHFINLLPQDSQADVVFTSQTLLAGKNFFEILNNTTSSKVSKLMFDKITALASVPTDESASYTAFLIKNEEQINACAELLADDFLRLNRGEQLADILMEKEIIRKFGS